ncbi:lachrymatory-factor synthase-like [Oryza brachyantha]|uniref:Lachrymatory-factor synthase n=1 Tax=Oryza brachyantha TaxID=4533 RepID=J3L3N0_ORYBR|nr:lachrymatory-factor synthase-like [Oryza brachyantha]
MMRQEAATRAHDSGHRPAASMADVPYDDGKDQAAATWHGSVRAAVEGPTPDQAWALLGDFCSLDRWVPSVQTCRRVEGADGRPGCVRYCAGPVNKAEPAAAAGWSRERLLELDPAGRRYSYEVVETNKGFGRYTATLQVEPDPAGCAVAWSFEADPVRGWTLEGFVGFLEELARGVAKRLEEEIMTQDDAPALQVLQS